MERQPTEWEKIIANPLSNKVLLYTPKYIRTLKKKKDKYPNLEMVSHIQKFKYLTYLSNIFPN